MNDPLALLSSVLNSQGNDPQAISRLSDLITAQPNCLAVLLQTIVPFLQTLKPDLKAWVLDNIVENALSRAPFNLDQKTTMSLQCLDVLSSVMHEPDIHNRKVVIQCLTSAYPLIFRHCCTASNSHTWDKVKAAKNTALNLWTSSAIGIRVAVTKLIQRVIQTQTRGNADPRMQNRAEPNLAMCSSQHPFMNAQSLEDEAKRLLEECIKTLYISSVPDVISAIVNVFSILVKARPALANSIFTSLVNWEPNSLTSTTPLQIKSVEKTFRIALAHLLRSGQSSHFTSQITEFLHKQNTRMLQAADIAKRKRDEEASKKRSRITDELNVASSLVGANKRRKIEDGSREASAVTFSIPDAFGARGESNPLANFDVKSLPLHLVTELLIASLQVVTDASLATAITEIRSHLPADGTTAGATAVLDPFAEDENEELTFEDQATEEEQAPIALQTFELQPPLPLNTASAAALAALAATRIRSIGVAADTTYSSLNPAHALAIHWPVILARVATKGLNATAAQNSIRQLIFDQFAQDPLSRYSTASAWMAEEWLLGKSGKLNTASPYHVWLARIFDVMRSSEDVASAKVALPAFFLEVPFIPPTFYHEFAELCEGDQLPVGFGILRELAVWRPSCRQAATDAIFSLCTHQTRTTRNAAIITVKRWVGQSENDLGEQTINFALSLLSRLEKFDDLPEPTTEVQVQQHIELFLSLCAKTPDLLDHLFASYSKATDGVQMHIRALVTMLIRSMGARHPKVVSLVESPIVGAETLVDRINEIFADGPR